MARKLLANGLTQQQEDFCRKYIEYGIGYKAYIEAYPNSKNWTRNATDSACSRLLANDKIQTRLSELNELAESTLKTSVNLNKRKLLETALTTMLECNTPAERQHFVSLIKMLFQKEGMLQPTNNVNIQVNNNTITAEVSDYLNL